MPLSHVAIDMLASRSGGAVTYLRNLLPRFSKRGAFRYTLILRRSQANELTRSLEGYGRVFAPELTLRPVPRLLWEQSAIPMLVRRQRIDLLFCPTDHPPLWVPCPLVMAVRNPTPYTDLKTVAEPARRRREQVMRAFTRAATRRARRVIFVSRSAADQINTFLSIPPGRVRVVYHGLDEVIAKGTEARLPADLPDEFLLAVSSFYQYKNYLALVRALAELKAARGLVLPLVICGRDFDRQNALDVRSEVARHNLPVQILGELNRDQLAVLYRRAKLFVFPSYLETFGHPLVEAMACGAPIAAGDIPTSRELCGDAAEYFDPHRSEAIAEVLQRLWNDAAHRSTLAARGLLRSRSFSWDRSAEETERVLAEALDDEGRP